LYFYIILLFFAGGIGRMPQEEKGHFLTSHRKKARNAPHPPDTGIKRTRFFVKRFGSPCFLSHDF